VIDIMKAAGKKQVLRFTQDDNPLKVSDITAEYGVAVSSHAYSLAYEGQDI